MGVRIVQPEIALSHRNEKSLCDLIICDSVESKLWKCDIT